MKKSTLSIEVATGVIPKFRESCRMCYCYLGEVVISGVGGLYCSKECAEAHAKLLHTGPDNVTKEIEEVHGDDLGLPLLTDNYNLLRIQQQIENSWMKARTETKRLKKEKEELSRKYEAAINYEKGLWEAVNHIDSILSD